MRRLTEAAIEKFLKRGKSLTGREWLLQDDRGQTLSLETGIVNFKQNAVLLRVSCGVTALSFPDLWNFAKGLGNAYGS